jgi:hypothetical protein
MKLKKIHWRYIATYQIQPFSADVYQSIDRAFKAKQNPTSLSRNGVSKAPSHDLPSEQGDWRVYF